RIVGRVRSQFLGVQQVRHRQMIQTNLTAWTPARDPGAQKAEARVFGERFKGIERVLEVVQGAQKQSRAVAPGDLETPVHIDVPNMYFRSEGLSERPQPLHAIH